MRGGINRSLSYLALSYGFYIVLAVIIVGYSLASPRFFSLSNIIDMFHAASPLMIVAAGLSLVIMARHIDISVGSIAFLSAGIGVTLARNHDMVPWLTFLVIIITGALLGAINGFIVVVLKVNPLITTLSTLLAFRGLALQLTNARVISLPFEMQAFGDIRLGVLHLDTAVALFVLLMLHVVHTRTPFGRHVTAIGNGPEVAGRLGVRVSRVLFVSFILSGVAASVGGIFSMLQVGAVSSRMGLGLEFTAIAVIVIGGISLFGGEGSIIPGVLAGGMALTIIENGLVHLGVSPFAYPLVRGALIFVAMYADSLRSLLSRRTRTSSTEQAARLPV